MDEEKIREEIRLNFTINNVIKIIKREIKNVTLSRDTDNTK